MADHDKSLFDRAKDALGMGDDREQHDDHQTDVHDDPHRNTDAGFGVDGAAQAAGSSGAAGGSGASGAMGGAGAASPADATPDPSEDLIVPAPGDRVRTEYEMGHEFDPEHEKVAESGVLAERAGDAEVDTWRHEDGERSDDEAQRRPE